MLPALLAIAGMIVGVLAIIAFTGSDDEQTGGVASVQTTTTVFRGVETTTTVAPATSAPEETSSTEVSTTAASTATTETSPATTEASPSSLGTAPDPAADVEARLRKRFAAVQKSRNLCDAMTLMTDLPDLSLIIGGSFSKEQIKTYIDLWESEWKEIEQGAPDDFNKVVGPVANVLLQLFEAVRDNDYDTTDMQGDLARLNLDSTAIREQVADYNTWREGNCPSDVTY